MITVVSDLDGTMMNRGQMEPETVEILRKFQQNNNGPQSGKGWRNC